VACESPRHGKLGLLLRRRNSRRQAESAVLRGITLTASTVTHKLAANPDNIKFVEGRPGNLAEHGGNFRNPTSGPLLSRALVVLQVAQIFTSAFATHMDEKRSGIQTGNPLWNPNALTIVDPTKAATALNGLTIGIANGNGTTNIYHVKDGQFLQDMCSKNCAVNPDTLKDKQFTVINPRDQS
jgi:hypothetical protein